MTLHLPAPGNDDVAKKGSVQERKNIVQKQNILSWFKNNRLCSLFECSTAAAELHLSTNNYVFLAFWTRCLTFTACRAFDCKR